MPSQLKFSDFDFFNLSKNYDFEIIKNYLEKYFKENRQAKLQNFFKSDKLTSDKNSFIEKSINEELKFINSFSNKLQTLYNKRIELYNKKTKKINPILGLLLHPEYWKKYHLLLKNMMKLGWNMLL
jgi:3-methyladenine DNA glycosylase AlkD